MYFKRLKELREDNDKRQQDIAEYLLMTQQQYHRYETGKRDMPNQILLMLADFYGVSLDYIFERTDIKAVNK